MILDRASQCIMYIVVEKPAAVNRAGSVVRKYTLCSPSKRHARRQRYQMGRVQCCPRIIHLVSGKLNGGGCEISLACGGASPAVIISGVLQLVRREHIV